MKPHLIQIAGIIDQAEATLLSNSGADHLGFPFRLDTHDEDLSEKEAASIIGALAPHIRAVLITYLNEADAVADLCGRLGCTTVQLHADVRIADLVRLRSIMPEIAIIKSLVVRGETSFGALASTVTRVSPHVDAFITDTFDPMTGASGATGKTHDWDISRRLVELSERPVILAGGLTPENVGEAIRVVRPAGVDVHTGVENQFGRKDERRVAHFVAATRAAFESLSELRTTQTH